MQVNLRPPHPSPTRRPLTPTNTYVPPPPPLHPLLPLPHHHRASPSKELTVRYVRESSAMEFCYYCIHCDLPLVYLIVGIDGMALLESELNLMRAPSMPQDAKAALLHMQRWHGAADEGTMWLPTDTQARRPGAAMTSVRPGPQPCWLDRPPLPGYCCDDDGEDSDANGVSKARIPAEILKGMRTSGSCARPWTPARFWRERR